LLCCTSMKQFALALLIVPLCALASTTELSAHHGTAQFDETKPVTITGSVSKVDWRGPHVHVYLDVLDKSGKVESWTVETSSQRELAMTGWPAEKLKIGTELAITGILARPDSGLADRVISSRYLIFASRKPVLVA